MRYRKKEFQRRIAALNQINRKFRNANVRQDMPGLEELTECQAQAIEMGNCLETIGEKAEPIVHMLEDYCEYIYQQSTCLNDISRCRKISKEISKQLDRILDRIRCDLPEGKKEILFLPYKADMWDSLESVWMAAQADKDCEALVMPIPYFDKNPDGSLGEMHDEKDRYPDYVPITDWQEYGLEERRPDVIYIHNPYDENNSVTSVHPAFYAKELKKYTDMLVYIPYFVGINDEVREELCVHTGVAYADYIIVESEEVKKKYLEAFRKFGEENDYQVPMDRLERKFLALGSPKLDRVRRLRKESIDIPEEWVHLIARDDGSKRKIILYNTSIKSLLRYNDNALKKMERVLDMFRNHPDIALLWRPHPLLVSTARRLLRRELYEGLCRIIEKYRQEGWGIYDNTADVERAIVLSDAYYGDWSSVVTLCQAAGKPIMIQNYEDEEDW